VLGDTKYQVLILLTPGSGMVVSNTEIDIVRCQILPHGHVAWKYFYIPSTSVSSERLVFLSWKLICKRRTCAANVNMLLSLNNDLLMSRLASYWFQKGVEVSVNTSTKILGIGIKIENAVSQSIFSLGNWRALHHHAACQLVNIHITWHFALQFLWWKMLWNPSICSGASL